MNYRLNQISLKIGQSSMQYDGTMNQQIDRPAVGWSNVYFDRMLIHCPTKLFPIYQNRPWTIQRRDDCSVDPFFQHIIL